MDDKSALLFLENQLCFPMYAASRLITKLYTPHLDALDLTYPQYLVMLVLWEHKSQSVSEIGNRLYLESNTLTPLLKRLEQKGLLSRTRSKTDERSVLIQITSAGEELKSKAQEIPLTLINSMPNDTLSEEEIKNFRKTLTQLMVILSAH